MERSVGVTIFQERDMDQLRGFYDPISANNFYHDM